MKKEETTTNEIMETQEVKTDGEVTQEEPKKEGIGSKVLNGAKKHGKKIAAGAVAIGVGIVCYALGARSGKGGYEETIDYGDDYKDVTDTYSDNE